MSQKAMTSEEEKSFGSESATFYAPYGPYAFGGPMRVPFFNGEAIA
jgi:hypothetical protein